MSNVKNYFKQAGSGDGNDLVINGLSEMGANSVLEVKGDLSLSESNYSQRWREFITSALSLNNVDNIQFIDKKTDFPEPVNDIITLGDGVTYFITNEIDLEGDRLVAGQNTVLIGGSSENCRLKSTGLTSNYLITSNWSLPMRNITIEAAKAINLDASANANQALDWLAVNFNNCEEVGIVKSYSNFIMSDSAFLDSGGLTFDGIIGTVAFNTTLFDVKASKTLIILPSTLEITRRFRVIYSSFVVLSGETGINASSLATIPNEGYILDTVNFSGGGAYTSGILPSDNKSRITNCRGINNSANIAQYFMNGNTTSTAVSAGAFAKILGTTTAGDFVEKFDVVTTSNKALYQGSLSGFYKITATASIVSGNNKVISLRVALNGVTTASSESSSTTNAGGRAEDVVCQGIVNLDTNDYIEIFVANATDDTAVIAEDLNVIIERLN